MIVKNLLSLKYCVTFFLILHEEIQLVVSNVFKNVRATGTRIKSAASTTVYAFYTTQFAQGLIPVDAVDVAPGCAVLPNENPKETNC